jgi:hypothetical protein
VDFRTGDWGLIGEVGLVNDDLLGNHDSIDCGDCTTRGCRSTPNRQFNRPSPRNPHSPIKNPQSIPNPQSSDPQFSCRTLPPRRKHALQRNAEVARQVRLQIIVGDRRRIALILADRREDGLRGVPPDAERETVIVR